MCVCVYVVCVCVLCVCCIVKFHKNYSTLGEIDEEVVNQLKESFNEVFKSWFATEFDENMITQEFAKKTTKKRKTGSTKTRGKMKYSLMDLINNGCIQTGKWLRLKEMISMNR